VMNRHALAASHAIDVGDGPIGVTTVVSVNPAGSWSCSPHRLP
jgi:hypothetical protein